MTAPLKIPTDYRMLRGAVTQVLLEGRARLEVFQLEIYWQTGDLICRYVQERKPATSDAGLASQLSHDLNIELSVLYRVIRFAKMFPRGLPANLGLTWSHYKELLTLKDTVKQKRLSTLALKNNWPVRRLRLEIQKERGPKILKREIKQGLLDEPERRPPGVCKIKLLPEIGQPGKKVVDLGFDLYDKLRDGSTGDRSQSSGTPRPVPERTVPNLVAGTTVRYNSKTGKWEKGGIKDDLYYYDARVERVVDGDTLLVHIIVGCRIIRRQYLRLRGINCAERDTKEGQRAKVFVEKSLQELSPSSKGIVPSLLIRTHRTDKYDRYISDVWLAVTDGALHQRRGAVVEPLRRNYMYINNALLEEGYAIRV